MPLLHKKNTKEKETAHAATRTFAHRLQRAWVLVLIFFLLLYVGGISFFILLPLSGQGRSIEAKMAQQRTEEVTLQTTHAKLLAIGRAYQTIPEKTRAHIFSLVPRASDFPTVFLSFQRLAEMYGFQVDSFSMQPNPRPIRERVETYLNPVDIRVRVLGNDYRQWKLFVRAITQMAPAMRIQILPFEPENDFQDFTLTTYFFP